MDLAALASTIGPPPAEFWPVDWGNVERKLGLRLPDDFKLFSEAYGPVLVGEWLWVLVPHDSDRGGYFGTVDTHQAMQRSQRADDPDSSPYAFHPEPAGLLIWGHSRGAEEYFWDTSASEDPNRWPVLTCAEGTWDRWEMSMTDALAARVRGELIPSPAPPLPPEIPGEHPDFRAALLANWPEDRTVLPATSPRYAWLVTPLTFPAPVPEPLTRHADEPADYLDLIATRSAVGAVRLLTPGPEMEAEHTRRAARLARRPTTIWPEPGGMRLWGVFETGETCWWLPETPNPDEWPVILLDRVGLGWQRLNGGTTDFLNRFEAGELDLPVLSASTGDLLAQLGSIIGEPTDRWVYDWPTIEARLGTRLPGDYKRLTEAYGPIVINGIFIEDPDTLHEKHAEMVAYMADWDVDLSGLLLCFTTESRDEAWWDTRNPDPDRWTLTWDVEVERHTFPGTLTELLIAELTRRLETPFTGLDPTCDGPLIW